MMNRRAFVAGAISVLGVTRATQAHQAGKVFRLGVLSPAGQTWGLCESCRQPSASSAISKARIS